MLRYDSSAIVVTPDKFGFRKVCLRSVLRCRKGVCGVGGMLDNKENIHRFEIMERGEDKPDVEFKPRYSSV